MSITKISMSLLVAALLGSGCTWVKPSEGSEGVALVKPEVAQNCEKIGTTSVQVKDRVGFINRNANKVAGELITMARNQAVKMGADTMVADGGVSDGSQMFILYKCR